MYEKNISDNDIENENPYNRVYFQKWKLVQVRIERITLNRIWNFLLTFRHYCTNEEIWLQPLETHLNRKIYSDGIFTRQREGKVFFPSIVATEFGKYLSSTVSSPIPREKYYLIFSPVGMISLSRLEEKKPGSLYRFR